MTNGHTFLNSYGGVTWTREADTTGIVSIDNARFRKPVVPGETLHVHVHKRQRRGSVWKFQSEAKVDGKVVAEATFAAMIVDK